MTERVSNIFRDSDRPVAGAALHIDVIADFVCPFCFVGKRRLDVALKAVKGPYDVSWYPFQLNPDLPDEGLPFDEYLVQRFESRKNVQPVLDHLVADGRSVGIDFDFDGIRHVPNTLRVHQVMQLAEDKGIDQSPNPVGFWIWRLRSKVEAEANEKIKDNGLDDDSTPFPEADGEVVGGQGGQEGQEGELAGGSANGRSPSASAFARCRSGPARGDERASARTVPQEPRQLAEAGHEVQHAEQERSREDLRVAGHAAFLEPLAD